MTAASTRLLDRTRAVLFDLDGTLLDTAHDLVNALAMVCAEEGHPGPDKQLAAQHVSNGAIGMVRVTFPHLDADHHERLRARLVSLYEQNLVVYTVPYPGVLATLDQLDAAGVRWGVVTNKLRYLAVPILEQVGLLERCATVVGGDTATRNKPHPEPLQFAMREMGVTPEAVAYVGDAEKDVLAGKAAGTRTIAVTWGYIVPDTDPYSWNADYTIEHPDQLLRL